MDADKENTRDNIRDVTGRALEKKKRKKKKKKKKTE